MVKFPILASFDVEHIFLTPKETSSESSDMTMDASSYQPLTAVSLRPFAIINLMKYIQKTTPKCRSTFLIIKILTILNYLNKTYFMFASIHTYKFEYDDTSSGKSRRHSDKFSNKRSVVKILSQDLNVILAGFRFLKVM